MPPPFSADLLWRVVWAKIHGRRYDELGDVAQNDGCEGHASRHFLILNKIYDALRRVYGSMVKKEPQNYEDYSDHRPDLTLMLDTFMALDLKVFDPLGAAAADVEQRGAFVAFGNTAPEATRVVNGRLQRGVPSDGVFKPRTGAGYVAPFPGDYARAQKAGVEARALLVEPSGACGPELVQLLKDAAESRSNKLTSSEYDETTWSARTWLTFVRQRISVAIALASSHEIAQALGMSVATDPRGQ